MPVRVVGVRFKKAGKIYYFEPGEEELAVGDGVIVETARGLEYGWVSSGPREVPDKEVVAPLKRVIRKASESDTEQLAENERKKARAMEICVQKVADHGLPMKIVDVEYTFDNNKIVFYFSAEGRIDFRELVKDLASVFRTRIELRQIGVRDEAKMLGGLGPCGRPLCCRTFLGDFAPVSIKMAKEQNLSLNPTKISGLCGRLMCCLKYESEAYRDARSRLPQVGAALALGGVSGTVIDVNPLLGKVLVDFGEDGKREVTAAELGLTDFPTSSCGGCHGCGKSTENGRISPASAVSAYNSWSSTHTAPSELDGITEEDLGVAEISPSAGRGSDQKAEDGSPNRNAPTSARDRDKGNKDKGKEKNRDRNKDQDKDKESENAPGSSQGERRRAGYKAGGRVQEGRHAKEAESFRRHRSSPQNQRQGVAPDGAPPKRQEAKSQSGQRQVAGGERKPDIKRKRRPAARNNRPAPVTVSRVAAAKDERQAARQ